LSRYLGVLLLIPAVIAGCNPGPAIKITSSPDDPVISELQIRPLTAERSGQTNRWRITARITDPNNDVIGGTASVSIKCVDRPPDGSIRGPNCTLNGTFEPPGFRLSITASDLTNSDRFTAILVVENAPAGGLEMFFEVTDAAGHAGTFASFKSFILSISGPTAPGAATRPEDIRGGLMHG
jgi:hypothetical protein